MSAALLPPPPHTQLTLTPSSAPQPNTPQNHPKTADTHTLTPFPQPYTPKNKPNQTGAYRAAHNLLLAHAKAVDVYRKKYQPTQARLK